MNFSIRTLLATTLAFACVLAAYNVVPTLTLSVVLLGPLPACAVMLCLSSRIRDRWQLSACALLIAATAFYVGLIGPLTAIAVMPENWGFVQARPTFIDFVNNAYPIAFLEAHDGPLTAMLTDYQTGWAMLVDSSFGT